MRKLNPKLYTVCVNDPPAHYGSSYFPRQFRYKKEAIKAAQDAVAAGASMARVECPGGGELDYRPVKAKLTIKQLHEAAQADDEATADHPTCGCGAPSTHDHDGSGPCCGGSICCSTRNI